MLPGGIRRGWLLFNRGRQQVSSAKTLFDGFIHPENMLVTEKSRRGDADWSSSDKVPSLDKRARRIVNARLVTKGVRAFRAANPFVPKVHEADSGANSGGGKENGKALLHRVFVRPRPLFQHEAERGEYDCISCVDNGIMIHEGSSKMSFRIGEVKILKNRLYSNVLPVVTDDNMYANISYLVDRAKRGKSSSVFMFGMTGSGKTYNTNILHTRVPVNLFAADTCPIKLIAYELVGNKCYDLLSDSKPEVFLRVGPDKNTHVCGNVTLTATTPSELQQLLSNAAKSRETTATGANATSSRSHAVYEVHLQNKGKLLLVDLAGNEGNIETMFHTKEQMAQAADINTSLSTLKACLHAVAVGAKHVPFRESALTRVLQSALTSPSCATAVLACVSPACSHLELTLGTLNSSLKLLGKVTKPKMEEIVLREAGVKQKGPTKWDRETLISWFQKQKFGCHLDIPESMTGAKFMKLNLIRLNQHCKISKTNDQQVSRAKANLVFQGLREEAKKAAARDLALRQQLKEEKSKVVTSVDFAKKATRKPVVSSAGGY